MRTQRLTPVPFKSRFRSADPYTTPVPADWPWQHAGVYFPHCVESVAGRLDELAVLPDDWNGYGARRIAPAMLTAVRRFLTRLGDEHGDLLLEPGTETKCLLPRVVPLSSGAVQLDWQVADRGLELEFETPDLIHYLKWCPARGVEDENTYVAADLGRSADLIRWVVRGNDA